MFTVFHLIVLFFPCHCRKTYESCFGQADEGAVVVYWWCFRDTGMGCACVGVVLSSSVVAGSEVGRGKGGLVGLDGVVQRSGSGGIQMVLRMLVVVIQGVLLEG